MLVRQRRTKLDLRDGKSLERKFLVKGHTAAWFRSPIAQTVSPDDNAVAPP
jgi:hypothetical protein